MPTPDPKYAPFLGYLQDSIPELRENRIDKQYLAGPAVDGIEVSVGASQRGCSVRLVLSRHRVDEGEAAYEEVCRLAKPEPATNVRKSHRTSRFSVLVFRAGSFPPPDREFTREWIQTWARRLAGLQSRMLAGLRVSPAGRAPDTEPEASEGLPRPAKKTPATEIAEIPPPPELPAEPLWVESLLLSSRLQSQRLRASRQPIPDERLRAALAVLADRGGRMPIRGLAYRLGLHGARAQGFLAAMRKVLNVDGGEVLALDDSSEFVELNLPLLFVQFDIPPEQRAALVE